MTIEKEIKRSSFSQHILFEKCPRSWYYRYIKKVPEVQEFKHMHAGSVLHKVLEEFYLGNLKFLEDIKVLFESEWKKYRLQDTDLNQDEFWLMVVNGMNVNIAVTKTELNLKFDDITSYLDAVNTNEHKIYDWKTSKRSKENEEEYTQQLKVYCWLYYRKFNIIPKEASVFYLRYVADKGKLSFEPTFKDIQETENWYNKILKEMQYYVANPDKLPSFNYNYNWSPFKHLWGTENNSIKYKLYLISSWIKVEGPMSEILQKQLSKKFSYELKNAHFIRQHKPGFDGIIKYWEPNKQILPIGFLNGLKKTLYDYGEFKGKQTDIEIIDKRKEINGKVSMPEEFVNGRVLRDYQVDAVREALKQEIGILQMATGSGKTEVAIELIRKLGVPTLFIVDRIELLEQTHKRICDTLGLDESIVGKIGGNNKDSPKVINVATIQTLTSDVNKHRDVLENSVLVIFDECHKVASKSYTSISKYLLSAKYRFGLSATPNREDGNDMAIYSVCGYPIFKVSTEELIAQNYLVEPKLYFIKNFNTKEEISEMEKKSTPQETINETKHYPIFYKNAILENEKRNMIIKRITEAYPEDHILILVKLVEQGNKIAELLNVPYFSGELNTKDRKQLMEDFNSKKISVIVGTVSIFSEGVDITSLDTLINAVANSGSIKSIQMLGRILRSHKGKTTAKYFDFIDENTFLRESSYKRMRTFKSEGHNVQIIDVEKNKTFI